MKIINVFDTPEIIDKVDDNIIDKLTTFKEGLVRTGTVCRNDIITLEASFEGVITNELPLGNFTMVKTNINVDRLLKRLDVILA